MDKRRIRTVLVIGDDVERLEFLCRALGNHFPVLSASSDEEGLLLADATEPDAIVADVASPRHVDDKTMFVKLGENPRTSDVNLVIITGKDEQGAPAIGSSLKMTRTPGPQRMLVEESVTAELLCGEVEELIGENPPEYCAKHDEQSCGRLPKRKQVNDKQISGIQQACPTWIYSMKQAADRA